MNRNSFSVSTMAARLTIVALAASLLSACGGGSDSPTAPATTVAVVPAQAASAVAAAPAASAASAAAPAASVVIIAPAPNLTLIDASNTLARVVLPGERDVELLAFRAVGDSSAQQYISQIVAAMPRGASMFTSFRLIDSVGMILGDANSYAMSSSADGADDKVISDFWQWPGWTDASKLYRLVADASQSAPNGASSAARIDPSKSLGGLSMHAFGAKYSAVITGGKITIASQEFAANYKPPMVSSDSLMYLPYVQAGTWLYYNINVSCDLQAAGGCFVDRAAFSSWNLSTGFGTDQKGRTLWSIGAFVPAGATWQFGFWAMATSDGPVSLHIEGISTWVGGRNLNPSMVMGNCLTIIDNGCKG